MSSFTLLGEAGGGVLGAGALAPFHNVITTTTDLFTGWIVHDAVTCQLIKPWGSFIKKD